MVCFFTEKTSESAARIIGQKRESGENPERSGHCKREQNLTYPIAAGREGKMERGTGVCYISNRKPGNLLSDKRGASDESRSGIQYERKEYQTEHDAGRV